MSDFFEKVLTGITGVMRTVADSLTYLLRKTRIKKQIKDTQYKKMQMLRNLGELVYSLHMSGDLSVDECAPMCDKITSYGEEIKELQSKAKEIEEQKIAPADEEKPQLPMPDTAVCTDNPDETDTSSAEM
ncbi:MAG: hypothetical protein IJC09_02070 [Clostridia bacterium]|nr:hypothetical protein [Clostridia bacterium]